MTNVHIREITTSVIAILIIVGGGFFILAQPDNPFSLVVSGFIGAVVQRYLQSSSGNEIQKVANIAVQTMVKP